MTTTDAPDPDVMAAELALGVLDGEDRAVALRRQLAEPAFAREVEQWRDHFAGLFADIRLAKPGTGVEERVMARIEGRPVAAAGWWRQTAIASSMAAAALLGVVVLRPGPSLSPPIVTAAPKPAPLVAAFTLPGRAAPVVAVYDANVGSVSMPGPMDVPAGRDAQLWAIVGSGAPQPLGLFHRAGTSVVAEAKASAPFAAGTTLAISIEPLGGSRTGAPTGPVVATGIIASV